MTRLTVVVDEQDLPLLAVLGDPAEVLAELAAHAADGVRRPGAWERSWVEQVFFYEEWHERVEPDPDVSWRVRPRGQTKLPPPAA